MASQSSFRIPNQPRNGLLRVTPPSRRLASILSGGLRRLYSRIDAKKGTQIWKPGAYTDENGWFKPEEGMPLLGQRYEFVQLIGKGQSSVLIEAKDTCCKEKPVAIKALHEHNFTLGFQETDCIQRLNWKDPWCHTPTLRIQCTFIFDRHYCTVFELLRPEPLSSYFKNVDNHAEKMEKIRVVAVQLLKTLGFLQQQNVLHADLKPDNILLSKEDDLMSLKVVDFGNAIRCIHQELSLYYDDFELQTLLYRAPEVMFGQPFGLPADMWSLGCILAELFQGQALFFARDKPGVLKKMVEILGHLPEGVFQGGKFFRQFKRFTAMSTTPTSNTTTVMNALKCPDYTFCNFLKKLLVYDPDRRMTAAEAARHPFLAPLIGVGFWVPEGYAPVSVDDDDIVELPVVDPEVRLLNLPSISLLRHGTHLDASLDARRRVTSPGTHHQVAEISPVPHRNSSSSHGSRSKRNANAAWLPPNTGAISSSSTSSKDDRNYEQPQPAHSRGAPRAATSVDVEPIDLTQPSPRAAANVTQSNSRMSVVVQACPQTARTTTLPVVGLSPISRGKLEDIQRTYERVFNQSQLCRDKFPQSQKCQTATETIIDQSAKNTQPHSQRLPTATNAFRALQNHSPAQAAATTKSASSGSAQQQPPVPLINDMFKPLENSMSKYFGDSQPWSGRAMQEVRNAMGKSLGVTSRSVVRHNTALLPQQPSSTRNSRSTGSFALQANRIGKVAQSSRVGTGKSARLTMNGAASHFVPKSQVLTGSSREKYEGHFQSSFVHGNGKKRSNAVHTQGHNSEKTMLLSSSSSSLSGLERPTVSGPYCPDVSDISNSQSMDETANHHTSAKSTTTSGRNSVKNHAMPGARRLKSLQADINANDVHTASRMTNNTSAPERLFEPLTEDSDSEPDEDNAVPFKKRKYYGKTSPGSQCLQTYKRSGASSQDRELLHKNKLQLKKVLQMGQESGAQSFPRNDWAFLLAEESGPAKRVVRRDSNVYNFHPADPALTHVLRTANKYVKHQSQSKGLPRKVATYGVEDTAQEVYEVYARGVDVNGRRVSPRKHASTARLLRHTSMRSNGNLDDDSMEPDLLASQTGTTTSIPDDEVDLVREWSDSCERKEV